MRTAALILLTPVRPDHTRALRAAIGALPVGSASPFARVFGTHVARLTVVDALKDRKLCPDPESGPLLLFSTDVDGDVAVHVERLRAGLGEHADAIWGHCVGYPGRRRARAFAAWMLEHRVPAGFSVTPYGSASVAQVRDALALRRRLVDFVIRCAELDPPVLKAAWVREFGDRRDAVR